MDESRLMGPKTIQEENTQGIMIYQSMSGDAEEGKSTFSMVGGSLMVHKGDVIYVTNTKCRIFLDHVDIKQEEAQKALIRVSGNSASRGWGESWCQWRRCCHYDQGPDSFRPHCDRYHFQTGPHFGGGKHFYGFDPN